MFKSLERSSGRWNIWWSMTLSFDNNTATTLIVSDVCSNMSDGISWRLVITVIRSLKYWQYSPYKLGGQKHCILPVASLLVATPLPHIHPSSPLFSSCCETNGYLVIISLCCIWLTLDGMIFCRLGYTGKWIHVFCLDHEVDRYGTVRLPEAISIQLERETYNICWIEEVNRN